MTEQKGDALREYAYQCVFADVQESRKKVDERYKDKAAQLNALQSLIKRKKLQMHIRRQGLATPTNDQLRESLVKKFGVKAFTDDLHDVLGAEQQKLYLRTPRSARNRLKKSISEPSTPSRTSRRASKFSGPYAEEDDEIQPPSQTPRNKRKRSETQSEQPQQTRFSPLPKPVGVISSLAYGVLRIEQETNAYLSAASQRDTLSLGPSELDTFAPKAKRRLEQSPSTHARKRVKGLEVKDPNDRLVQATSQAAQASEEHQKYSSIVSPTVVDENHVGEHADLVAGTVSPDSLTVSEAPQANLALPISGSTSKYPEDLRLSNQVDGQAETLVHRIRDVSYAIVKGTSLETSSTVTLTAFPDSRLQDLYARVLSRDGTPWKGYIMLPCADTTAEHLISACIGAALYDEVFSKPVPWETPQEMLHKWHDAIPVGDHLLRSIGAGKLSLTT